MIRRIELTNFMSHRHSVIEFAEGLTVLVGPNNCGKSAVVTALKILAHNDNSKYVTRHGEKECRVRVELVDEQGENHAIEWARRNSPRYTIDGREFDRLRNAGLPPQLDELLRMPIVHGEGNIEFDIHFGEQKSPIFLLDSSATQTAQFFASSSDAAHLVRMQRLHLKKTQEAKAALTAIDRQLNLIDDELKRIGDVSPIDIRIDELTQAKARVENEQQQTRRLASLLPELRRHGSTAELFRKKWSVVTPLTAPPALQPAERLASWIGRWRETQRRQRQSREQVNHLSSLSSPPNLSPTDGLRRLNIGLQRSQQRFVQLQEQRTATAGIVPLPVLDEVRPLQDLIRRLVRGQTQQRSRRRALDTCDSLTPVPQVADPRILRDTLQRVHSAQQHLDAMCRESVQIDIELEELNRQWENLRSRYEICPTCGQDLPQQIAHFHRHDAGVSPAPLAHAPTLPVTKGSAENPSTKRSPSRKPSTARSQEDRHGTLD